MKKYMVMLCIVIFITACSKSKNVQICEGVSVSGNGVSCGLKFSTGDLTALVKNSEPFGVSTISVQIFSKKDGKGSAIVDNIPVYVNPESASAYTTITFVEAGLYTVKAIGKDGTIGEAEIEIIDL